MRFSPRYGGAPVRISHSIAPSPNTSTRGSASVHSPRACSGAMYAGVPATRSAGLPSVTPIESADSRAKPQSISWTSPNAPTMTFAGFRSQCTTPRECANATVWQTFS